jgi:uncharacterized protein (DUF1501 family)
MSGDASRRVFLRGAGLAAVGVGLAPTSLLVRTARAAAGEKVLVKVFLRGAADGLNLCAPHGDPEYYNLRQAIALPRPGSSDGVVNLDGYFGMHPELAPLKPFFDDGRLAFVHAVGNPQVTRSHFDAQDFMESGTPGDKQTPTGWLDRAIARIPGSEVTQAVSFSSQLVRSFLGPEPVLVAQNLSSFDLHARNWRVEAETRLRAMYEADPTAVGDTGSETFEAINTLLRAPTPPPSNGAAYPTGTVGSSLRQAAGLVKVGIGTRCIYVNVTGGFDTHSNQLQNNTTDYRPLGQALAAFATDLGGLLDSVVLMVTTEFGRTAAVNGAAGTDHGTGYCMMVLGGRVRGGRVLGRWPGLGRGQLYEGRDLAATTDFRDVFQEVARGQLGIAESLFPGYAPGPGVGVVA